MMRFSRRLEFSIFFLRLTISDRTMEKLQRANCYANHIKVNEESIGDRFGEDKKKEKLFLLEAFFRKQMKFVGGEETKTRR